VRAALSATHAAFASKEILMVDLNQPQPAMIVAEMESPAAAQGAESASPAASAGEETPNAGNEFLSGLDIVPQEEPARPWVVKPQPRKPKASRRPAPTWTHPDAESFTAGIELEEEPEAAANAPRAEPQPESAPESRPVAETTPEAPSVDETFEPVHAESSPPEISEVRADVNTPVEPVACANIDGIPEPSEPEAHCPTPSSAKRPQRLEDFRLEAELVLRGAVPEGARLTLDGREVPVDEEGEFALSCEIRDGTLLMPLRLQSEAEAGTEHETLIRLDVEKRVNHKAWNRVRILPPRNRREP
jgi:hypothetical protein